MTQTKSKQVTKPVPVALLSLDPHNARKHDERSIQAIKASLERFGQVKPIVVQKEGMVVRCGNGTLLAAQELGWKSLKAIVSEMTEAEIVAYAIADNRTAELAEWDEEALGALLNNLREDDFPLLDIGFDDAELDAMLGGGNSVDLPYFQPSDDEQSRLDEKQQTECPECGHVF